MELCSVGRRTPKLSRENAARKAQAAACCGCSGGCSPCVLRHFLGAPLTDVDIVSNNCGGDGGLDIPFLFSSPLR